MKKEQIQNKRIFIDLAEICPDYKHIDYPEWEGLKSCWFCSHYIIHKYPNRCEIYQHEKYREILKAQRHPNQTKIEAFVYE